MKKILTFLIAALPLLFANAQTVILTEAFEGTGIPSGWTQQTAATDGGFKFGTSTVLSSSSFPVPNNGTKAAGTNDDGCNCNKLNDLLILPVFDFSAQVAVSMKFDLFYFDAVYQGAQEHAYVSVSTDGGTTWVDEATLPGGADWQTGYIVNLSAYAGMSNVLVAFRYTDGGGWLYGLAIDNVSLFTPADHDVSVTGLTIPRFKESGTFVTISGEFTNYGAQTLNTVDISWSDGTNTYTDNLTGLNVPYLGTYTFTHSTTLSLAQAISYNYTVWADNPNGNVDANAGNNQLAGVVSGVSYIPSKKMLAEEATGTWCGWCPRGTEWMDFMTENYPDEFVGIAVHNGDPMTVTAYDSGVNAFPGFSGYPSVIVDRNAIWDPSDLENILQDYLDRIAPIAPTVSASIDVATRTLSIDADAEFVTQLSNIDYRFNIVLTEDNVTGTGAGYAQTNYYAGPAAPTDPIPGYGSDWDALPATVPAADMVYNHVGRAILGGWAGTAGSVPTAVVAGDVAVKNYTVSDFNTGWNPYNMHAVVMVIDNATGEVLNTNSEQIDVICPANFGAVATATPSSDGSNGSIELAPPSPTYGFGGYTYLWSNGETTPSISGLTPGTYTLVVTDKIGCSQSIDVVVTSSSNVEDIATLSSFGLTPNPASSVSVLSASFAQIVDVKVEVLSVEGKVIAAASFDKTASVTHSFDLSDVAEGMYLVKMSVGNQVHTERLVVTK
ncbi:MAG: Omp28-related outer membrane protein [Saprospiraceae bacterium]|nr:Omp28-related outer membrane protein [Saprospiraceae bacterium]